MTNKFQDMFPFKLKEQQLGALEFIDTFLEKRHYQNRRFIRVGGLAGTGKTSVIATAFKNQCIIAAPTWVAAKRLGQEMQTDVATYHSVFLIPSRSNEDEYKDEKQKIVDKFKAEAGKMKKADLTVLRQLREQKETELRRLDARYPLMFGPREDDEDAEDESGNKRHVRGVIIDESSMMTEEHAEHILAQGVPVVFIGDHGQLPPVQGTPFFTTMDYTLNEICRQKDRELLELLHLIRKNGSVPRVGKGTTYKIVGGEVEDYYAENSLNPNHDAVIAYKVSDVRKFNDYFSPNKEPAVGDLIRCYKQYQDRFEGRQRRFRNGFVYKVMAEHADGTYDLQDIDRGYLLPHVQVNRKLFHCARIDANLDPDTHEPFDDHVDGMRADFVYSMTGHKSQGSQWPHVIVYADKPGVVGAAQWRRWLYTAASRATEYLTIIVPGAGRLKNGV